MRNIIKGELTVQEVVDIKLDMDKSNNPAFIFEKTRMLQNKSIRIKNAVVQDIISSNNVDYRFCVIIRVPSSMGDIDCHVYAESMYILSADLFPREDIKTVSKLKKGNSNINVKGNFSKFFTQFDDTYTKIEIVKADIDIND